MISVSTKLKPQKLRKEVLTRLGFLGSLISVSGVVVTNGAKICRQKSAEKITSSTVKNEPN